MSQSGFRTTETAQEVWRLATRHLGQCVQVFEEVDSTNSRALAVAGQPDTAGLAFLADQQRAGRGQHGRTWTAPARSSVLLSVLLYPPASVARPVLLTAWAAVAVCTLVERFTRQTTRIKWPNDVFLAGKKVCGILIEQSQLPTCLASVVGIGLNLQQRAEDFRQANLPDATSLALAGVADLDNRAVARLLLHELDWQYEQLLLGQLDRLEEAWRERLDLVGQRVFVEGISDNRTGQLLHLGFDSIRLLRDSGEVETFAPESIRHIQLDPTFFSALPD